MASPKRVLGILNKLSTVFLVFVGFLLVFFTTSKMRPPIATDVTDGNNVAHADAPYGQASY